MAERTADARRHRSGSEDFVERHREVLFALSLLVGGLIFALGLTFLVITIAVGTEPPGTRFATQGDRLVVGAVGLVAFTLGWLVIRQGFRLAGW